MIFIIFLKNIISYRSIIKCFYAGLLLIITGCSTSKEKISEVSLTSIRDIQIPLDFNTSKMWRYMEYWTDLDDEYIVYKDHIKKNTDVHFACLNDPSKSFKVAYQLNGPNGLKGITGFHVVNKDSIFILNAYQYKVYLTNSKGEIIDKYFLLKEEKPNENTSLPWVSVKTPMHYHKGVLYIPSIPDTSPFKSNYTKNQLLITLDLETKAFDYSVKFPTSYHNKFWASEHAIPSFTWHQDQVSISFPIDENVFYGSVKKTNSLDEKKVKSEIIHSFSPLPYYTSNREEKLKIQLGSDQYYSIIYDPYRNLYYRTCLKKYDDESVKNMINRKSGKANERAIMILDGEFNLLNEIKLPTGKHIIQDILVIKEGLLIQKSNDNEDIQEFELFEVINN